MASNEFHPITRLIPSNDDTYDFRIKDGDDVLHFRDFVAKPIDMVMRRSYVYGFETPEEGYDIHNVLSYVEHGEQSGIAFSYYITPFREERSTEYGDWYYRKKTSGVSRLYAFKPGCLPTFANEAMAKFNEPGVYHLKRGIVNDISGLYYRPDSSSSWTALVTNNGSDGYVVPEYLIAFIQGPGGCGSAGVGMNDLGGGGGSGGFMAIMLPLTLANEWTLIVGRGGRVDGSSYETGTTSSISAYMSGGTITFSAYSGSNGSSNQSAGNVGGAGGSYRISRTGNPSAFPSDDKFWMNYSTIDFGNVDVWRYGKIDGASGGDGTGTPADMSTHNGLASLLWPSKMPAFYKSGSFNQLTSTFNFAYQNGGKSSTNGAGAGAGSVFEKGGDYNSTTSKGESGSFGSGGAGAGLYENVGNGGDGCIWLFY